MRNRMTAMALIAVCCSCAIANGSESAEEELAAQIAVVNAESAAAVLAREGVAATLAERPKLMRRISEQAATAAQALAARDPENSIALMDGLVNAASACVTANPKDQDAVWGAAAAHLARGRTRRTVDPKANADDWVAAAGVLRQAPFSTSDDGQSFLGALRLLIDAPFDQRASHVAVKKEVQALTRATCKAYPQVVELALPCAQANYDFATRSLGRKKADAKDFLRGCFDSLKGVLAAGTPERDALTLHHNAVTMCIEARIVLGEPYRMRSDDVLSGMLTYQYPEAAYWNVEPATDDISKRVCQAAPDGSWARRARFKRYSWAIKYIFSDGTEVGGDNVKNLCKLAMEQMDRIFSKVESRTKPKKGKLNSDNRGYSAEMRGLDANGKPLVARFYLFRGKTQQSYQITILDSSMADDMGPAMKAFLDTVGERER